MILHMLRCVAVRTQYFCILSHLGDTSTDESGRPPPERYNKKSKT